MKSLNRIFNSLADTIDLFNHGLSELGRALKEADEEIGKERELRDRQRTENKIEKCNNHKSNK